jgi:Bacterial PH domain
VTHATEYEFEGVPGLPGTLPKGEQILWKGQPSWTHFAVRVLHIRKIWIYFGLLAVWVIASIVHDGGSWQSALTAASWTAVAAALATGILAGLAWCMARSTIYTITNKRVVLRSGVALPMAINIPFSEIDSASVRMFGDGNGDIPLHLSGKQRLAFLVLWPNARAWHINQPQPMLRAIDDAQTAGQILAGALAAATDQSAVRVIETHRPATAGSLAGSGQIAAA